MFGDAGFLTQWRHADRLPSPLMRARFFPCNACCLGFLVRGAWPIETYCDSELGVKAFLQFGDPIRGVGFAFFSQDVGLRV